MYYPSTKSPFEKIIEQQGFVLLDGGLATELENRGHNLNNKLWSASILINHPQEIKEVHLSYLKAGADCITTATYQATLPGFMAEGISKQIATNLIKSAVKIANEARNQYLEKNKRNIEPLIAISIGPYGAYLADGSEFSGNYSISKDELRAFHESRLEILMDTKADVFAFETIPSFQEAEVLLDLLKSIPDAYAWISFSCKDGMRISDGSALKDCIKLFKQCKQIIAVGINCTAPRYISSLISEACKGAPDKPIVTYPNAGETYDEKTKSWIGSSDQINIESAVVEWYNLGARLIGGCCRTNPVHIAKIKNALLNKFSPINNS